MATKRTRIYRGTNRNLAMLAGKLQQGELVAVPTETVYGLAANALDATACARIFTAKGRPTTDPLIVHIHEFKQLSAIAKPNAMALRLAEAFWPGPLTLILPKTELVPGIVTAGRDSVAVRMPSHKLFLRLLRKSDLPLAAPSANPFGYVSPTTARHVLQSLNGRVGYILDGGASKVGVESTIIDIRNPAQPKVLRPGAITAAQIGLVTGRKVTGGSQAANAVGHAQLAPGQLKQHYSPKARIVLHKRIADARFSSKTKNRVAVLYFKKPARELTLHEHWLSASGSHDVAARTLFAKLRELDARHYREIHAETAPAGPLADAINDRLRRAAAKG